MPPLQHPVSGGARPLGGIVGYPSERLYEEVAYVAYHFHWPPDDILDLEHHSRQRWVEEIGKINQQVQSPAAATAPQAQPEEDRWWEFLLNQ